jgi:hypothetical protein
MKGDREPPGLNHNRSGEARSSTARWRPGACRSGHRIGGRAATAADSSRQPASNDRMHPSASFDTYVPSAPQLPVSSKARPSVRRSRPGSRRSGECVGDRDASGCRLESAACVYRPCAPGSDLRYLRAQRSVTPGFERSETEHVPFAARLAFARPSRTRRRSKRRSRKREPQRGREHAAPKALQLDSARAFVSGRGGCGAPAQAG